MASPPVIVPTAEIIGEGVFKSTWGKYRTTLIVGEENFSVGDNSLQIEKGFHPSECLFLRCWYWPEKFYDYSVSPPDLIGEGGGIINYRELPPFAEYRIYLGGWSDSFPGAFAGAQDNLDYYDCTNFLTGRVINGSLTTTDDWWSGTGQFESGTFSGYTTISDMTSFG